MKKQRIFITIITILIIIYIIILKIPKNYEIDYIVNKVKINEKYDKKTKIYNYVLIYQNNEYPIFVEGKYQTKQKHIKDIQIIEDNENTCLNIDLKNTIKVICKNENELIDYRLISEELYTNNYEQTIENTLKSTYENISIYDISKQYLVWNYNGYINLSKENNKIKIFETEKYSSTNTYQSGHYLIIPDYDSSYYFKKIYLFNAKKNNITTIDFDYEISYNLLFLGTYKNKVYFLDTKNRNEYVINLKKATIKLLNEKDNNGLFYNGNKLVIEPVETILKRGNTFPSTKNNYEYELKNETLYQIINNYQIKISNKKITSIISQIEDTIYYLVEDELYSYNYNDGEKLLLKNKEWKFNYKNQIFIFNK